LSFPKRSAGADFGGEGINTRMIAKNNQKMPRFQSVKI